MKSEENFQFERARGIVWVCDIANSTKLLNDNKTAGLIEEFLPRLHWLGIAIVKAAGGTFIKWTGDGFLAWFEIPLHRDLPFRARGVMRALWHLTVFVNVTQMGLKADARIRLGHGVTYEQDALLTRIRQSEGGGLDVLGRSVVLAFRLAGVRCAFPSVVTQREIGKAIRSQPGIDFAPWKPDADERLRYFKGENWGTTDLYKSVERPPRRQSMQQVLRNSKKALGMADGRVPIEQQASDFVNAFLLEIDNGPNWARQADEEYQRFIHAGFYGTLRKVVDAFS